MHMLRTCEKLHWGLGWPNCVGMSGWFKCVGMIGWLELALPTNGTRLFNVRPRVLSKTLSHMWGKLNLPIFLFKVGLSTLINMDFLIFLANPCPPSQLFGSFVEWRGDLCCCYDDVYRRDPSGAP